MLTPMPRGGLYPPFAHRSAPVMKHAGRGQSVEKSALSILTDPSISKETPCPYHPVP